MEDKNNRMLLLTLSFLSLVLLRPAVARPVGGTVNLQLYDVCRKTSYPTLCTSTLGASLDKNVSLTDPMAVFRASLKAALAEVTAAIPHLDEMIKEEKDEFDRGCLVSCKKEYNDAIEDIKRTMTQRYYNMVTSTLSACISYISSCGDDFGENRVNKAAQINDRAMNIIDNSLAFAEAAKWD